MNLPDGCELVYIVPGEAWYRNSVKDELPSVQVVAHYRYGGCDWEFDVQEGYLYSDGGPSLLLRMFDDAWGAFDQIPEFFTALQTQQPHTLTELRRLLDSIGARDVTQRERTHA